MKERLLLDSNILIDLLRDRPQAVAYFKSIDGTPTVSSITVAELYAGVREGNERGFLDQFILGLDVIAVTFEIAMLGGLFRRKYLRSHQLDVVDALIAATAETEKATLVTLNRKHFPMFSNLIVPYERS